MKIEEMYDKVKSYAVISNIMGEKDLGTKIEEDLNEISDLLWAIMVGLFMLIGIALFAFTLVR